MSRIFVRPVWHMLLLLSGLACAPATRADALSATQILREGGCGGILPAAPTLHHSALLDRAARHCSALRR